MAMASPSDESIINTNAHEQQQQQSWLVNESFDYGGYGNCHLNWPAVHALGQGQPPQLQVYREHQQLQQFSLHHPPPQQLEQQQQMMMMRWAIPPPNHLNDDNISHARIHSQDNWQLPPPATTNVFHTCYQGPLSQNPSYYANNINDYNPAFLTQYRHQSNCSEAVVINASNQQQRQSSPFPHCFAPFRASATHLPLAARDAAANIQTRRSPNFLQMMDYSLPCGNFNDDMTINHTNITGSNSNSYGTANAAPHSTLTSSSSSSSILPPMITGVEYPTRSLKTAGASAPSNNRSHHTSDNNNMGESVQIMSHGGLDELLQYNIMPPIHYPSQSHFHLPPTTPLGMMSISSTPAGTGRRMSAAEKLHHLNHHHHNLHPLLVNSIEMTTQPIVANCSDGTKNNTMKNGDSKNKLSSSSENNDIITIINDMQPNEQLSTRKSTHPSASFSPLPCSLSNDNSSIGGVLLPPLPLPPPPSLAVPVEANTFQALPLVASTSSSATSAAKCVGVTTLQPSQSASPTTASNSMMNSLANTASQPLSNGIIDNNNGMIPKDGPMAIFPSSMLCAPVGVLQPPPAAPPTSLLSASNTASVSQTLPMTKDTPSLGSNHQPVVIPSQGGGGGVQKSANAVEDTTSHDYLRSLLRPKKKRSTTAAKKSSSSSSAVAAAATPSSAPPRAVGATTPSPITEISIPSTFSPTHSYRAMAAYSLLRTLSKELRLSPFTFQAFTNALMLPVPSKLLGEVHFRLLRVLFAAAAAEEAASPRGDGKKVMGKYFYDKFGDGGGVDMIQRRKRVAVRRCVDEATAPSNIAAGVGMRLDENGDETEQINHVNMTNGNDDNSANKTGSQYAISVVEYGDEEELVPKKGGNNLYFLDQATWPLFFQDYALLTEKRILEVFDTDFVVASELDENKKASLARGWKSTGVDDDNDEFIDMRSVAMLPSEDINMYPSTIPQFDDDYDDGDEEEVAKRGLASYSATNCTSSRCPAGPSGRRNHLGRFVCCPSHILAAVQMDRNILSPASTSVATSSGSANSAAPATMTTAIDSVLNMGAKARKSSKSERKVRRKSSVKISKWANDETDNDDDDIDVDTDDDDYKPSVKYNNNTCRITRSNGINSPGVRRSRVSNIETASTTKSTKACAPSALGVAGWGTPQCQAIMTPGQEPTIKATASSLSPLSNNIQQTFNHHQSHVDATTKSFHPILHEVQQVRLPEESAFVVSREIEKALDCFLLNRPSASDSSEVETIDSYHATGKTTLTKCPQDRPDEASNDHILAHMVSVHLLEHGIPHHHLCLNDKLTILEFLLDELLQVAEIAVEMSRRQDSTSQFSSLYGAIPSPRDYEEMENADECKICGVEGQLLCCDGCPGSFHRACIGIAINAKLPEGKWLCPECKIVDASKMAPLESDLRPRITWFTLSELGWPAFHRILEGAGNDHYNIPSEVEFLVTSGLVFSRYRTTLAPFDPLHIPASMSNKPVLHSLPPPSPLNSQQLAELLKLLGPQLCSFMPWLRISFTPQKLFSSYLILRNDEVAPTDRSAPQTTNPIIQHDSYLRFLIYYQDTTKEFLANHPDLNNPMVYMNGYNRAPPIPLIQNQQGLHVMITYPQNYPAETSALSVAILDMTIHRDQNACIPFIDPIKSIRNSMIQLEQTLGKACLLDYSGGTTCNAPSWRRMVHRANSIAELGSLLVNLIDACSIVAFVSEWYMPKECSSPVSASVESTKWISISSEEWNSKRESTRRKWERSGGNDILRFHKGALCSSLTKRGKMKKTTEVSIETVCAKAESNDHRGDTEQNSLTLSSSRRRSDRFNTIRQQIEEILGVAEMEPSDSEMEIVELKLDRLERIIAEDDHFSINWPIAGKTLFEPDGSLPRPIVRRLARNAGSARAPSVTYDTAYDVGETALCHRWRKITNKCTTYEGLLQCLRFVNAHINKVSVMTATTAVNRIAGSVKDTIRCVHTDPCTGFKEYFVAPVNKNSGRWYSEPSVDIISLIHHRCEKRKSFLQLAPIHESKNDYPSQSGKKREASTHSVDATNFPTKKSKVEGAKQVDSRLQLVIDKHRDVVVRLMHESATKGEKSVSTDLLEYHRSKNLIVMRHANQLIYQESAEMLEEYELKNLLTEAEKEGRKQTISERRRALNEKKRSFQAIVDSHRGEILKLMKEISCRGESVVGSKLIEDVRSKTLIELRSANILIGQVGGKLLTECELQSRMSKAEEQAGRVCELEVKERVRKEKERDFRNAVDRHRDVIVCLMKECAARGESNISSTLLNNTRSQNLVAMRATNQLVHEAGGKLLSEIELKIRLTKAEEAASKMYQLSAKRTASTESNMSEPLEKRRKEMRAAIEEKKLEFQAAVDRHRIDTLRLMKACALKGEAGVSSEDMTAVRNVNFIALESANRSIHLAGGTMLVDLELKIHIARAEKEAVDMYIRDLHTSS